MKKKKLSQNALLDPVAIGANLKVIISEAGYRVSEIQEFLHLSCPQPIYRWFRGKALPTLQHLCALADLLDVSVDDLLARKSGNKREYVEIDILYCIRTKEISRRSQILNAYQQVLNLQNRHTA